LPEFSQTSPKNFGPLFVRIVSHDDRFPDDFQKRSSCDSAHPVTHFCHIKVRWAPFCPYFQGVYPDFQLVCEGFHRFCSNFEQIKTFGGPLAPPPPTPLLPLHVGLQCCQTAFSKLDDDHHFDP